MTGYKRSPEAVLSQLVENQADQVITKKACKIQVPIRYAEIGLGQIGINTFIYGLFALIMIDTGEYTVCNVNAMVEINPSKLMITTIDEVDYHEFYFEPGQVVIKTTNLVKRDTMMYNVLDEFILKGKVPWYVEYDDLGSLFDTSKYHANSDIAANPEVIEFIASMITRSKDDRTKYIRTVAKSYKDTALDKISYVPLQSIYYSVNSTVNKLAGSYFSEGVKSALVNPTDRVDKIERILRA